MLPNDVAWEDVRPLIFYRLSLRWDEITLKQPFPLKPSENWKLRSFPLPGYLTPPSLEEVSVRQEGLTFPRYGIYNIVGFFGVAKIVLIDPAATPDDHIVTVSRFVSGASWHSAADTHLAHNGGERYPFYPSALVRKLFYSDQPLALWCGDIADVLAYLLHSMGFSCRQVHLKNSNKVGHVFIEVFFPVAGKWIMVDPDFGVMIRRDGHFLSAGEAVALRKAGKTNEIEIVDLSDAPFGDPEVNFPSPFTGQFTWKPEYMSGSRARLPHYYHDIVIDKGFEETFYSPYRFENAVVTRVTPTLVHTGWVSMAEIDTMSP